MLPFSQMKEVCGQDHLEAVMLDTNGTVEKRPARALFVFIGAKPSTEWVCDQVLCDGKGFVLTGRDLVTDPRYANSLEARPASRTCSKPASPAFSPPATAAPGPWPAWPLPWARAAWPSSSCTSTWTSKYDAKKSEIWGGNVDIDTECAKR